MIFVVSGPGGVGKGTLVDQVVATDPSLWLSKSWTTRPRREGEPSDAYKFVTATMFQERLDAGGFLEWVEFLGNRYGTPIPVPPPGTDVVLEIELHGAQSVRRLNETAVLILVVPPSVEVLEQRLRKRGDSEERIRERIDYGQREMETGHLLADEIVVNDDLEAAVEALRDIVARARSL